MELLFRPQHKEHEALKGISFQIQRGELVGLIGANGAGKTTLLKILSGLIPPTSGEARVLEYEPFSRPLDFRRKISLVMGQKAQLWWDLPGIDAFELLRAIYQIPKDIYKKRLYDLAAILAVEKLLNTQIRRLSLGERMKMELIGALLHWPEVVFLDEPTIGLDVIAAQSLRRFLKNYNAMVLADGVKDSTKGLQRQPSTMIITSHNMDDIEKLCSRVLIIKEGQLIFDGSPQSLVSAEKRVRVRLAETPSSTELANKLGLSVDEIDIGADENSNDSSSEDGEGSSTQNTYHFKTTKEEVPKLLQKIMGHYQVIDMGIEEQSLEDVIEKVL
jgi:ABC-2 type transport system ATP-binding protein